MRRVTCLAARTISASIAVDPRLAQTTISSSHPLSRRFGSLRELSTPSITGGVAGIVFFSAAAASSLAQDVHAKESSQKFNPKEVVLYQYEACPFCNKVKGFTNNTQPHGEMLNQHIQGTSLNRDFVSSGRGGRSWFDLPPSRKPPPEHGYPQLPSIDWG